MNIELWDLYTENRVKTGKIHIRGNPIPENMYHLSVNVWIKNLEGKYLISQRSKSRPTNPLKYECVKGSVLREESSLQGALREVKEELGINLNPSMGKFIFSEVIKSADKRHSNVIVDVWLFKYDGRINLNDATTDEVKQARWMTIKEIYKLYKEGKMTDTSNDSFKKVIMNS